MTQASEFAAHKATYHGFLALFRWGTGIALVVALLVILLVAQ